MAYTQDNAVAWIRAFAAAVADAKNELTALDAAIGDADHGANLDRGMRAAVEKLASVAEPDVGAVLKSVGMTLVSTVGGASGPLYGTLFLQLGRATAGKSELTPADWLAAWQAGVDGVMARGKAGPGDKTMVDALLPGVNTLRQSIVAGAPLETATRQAAEAARRGALDTVPLVARRGRASYLGERSAGHQDPGATSTALLFEAAASVLR